MAIKTLVGLVAVIALVVGTGVILIRTRQSDASPPALDQP